MSKPKNEVTIETPAEIALHNFTCFFEDDIAYMAYKLKYSDKIIERFGFIATLKDNVSLNSSEQLNSYDNIPSYVKHTGEAAWHVSDKKVSSYTPAQYRRSIYSNIRTCKLNRADIQRIVYDRSKEL